MRTKYAEAEIYAISSQTEQQDNNDVTIMARSYGYHCRVNPVLPRGLIQNPRVQERLGNAMQCFKCVNSRVAGGPVWRGVVYATGVCWMGRVDGWVLY